jgi:hypothetical protein
MSRSPACVPVTGPDVKAKRHAGCIFGQSAATYRRRPARTLSYVKAAAKRLRQMENWFS